MQTVLYTVLVAT